MLINLVLGVLLLCITSAVHASAMVFARDMVRSHTSRLREELETFPMLQVLAVILLMFVATLIEVLIWAFVYLSLGAIQGMEKALYFSMVTFTTLGYGDVVLPDQWQLLSAIEATNGIIIFGWTTAIVIAVIQRVYFKNA